jgi:hypothetical protein
VEHGIICSILTTFLQRPDVQDHTTGRVHVNATGSPDARSGYRWVGTRVRYGSVALITLTSVRGFISSLPSPIGSQGGAPVFNTTLLLLLTAIWNKVHAQSVEPNYVQDGMILYV